MQQITTKIKEADAVIAIVGAGADHSRSMLAIRDLIAKEAVSDYFVVTTDTSGAISDKKLAFGAANIWELNGNSNYYQCDHGYVFEGEPKLELKRCTALTKVQECNARPNVLEANDGGFNSGRMDEQAINFKRRVGEIQAAGKKLMILEYNAGGAGVLTSLGESLYQRTPNATFLRVGSRGVELYREEDKEFVEFQKEEEGFQTLNYVIDTEVPQEEQLGLQKVSNTGQVEAQATTTAPPPPKEESIEVQGYKIETTNRKYGETLLLNGVGLRTKWFMSLYVGALYLKNKTSDGEHVMNADEAMMIKMTIISSLVTLDKISLLINEGFEKASDGDMSAYKERLDKYLAAFEGLKIASGAVMSIVYLPGKGLSCYLEDEHVVTVEGLDFKKIYFGIWFCDEPCQQSLKDQMLQML